MRPLWCNAVCSNPFTTFSEQEKGVQMKGEEDRERGEDEKETERKEGRESL